MKPKFGLFSCNHPKSNFPYSVIYRGNCYTIEEINLNPAARSFNDWWAKVRNGSLCYAYLNKLKQGEHWDKYKPTQFKMLERKIRESVELHGAAILNGLIPPVSAQENSIIEEKRLNGIVISVVLLLTLAGEGLTIYGISCRGNGFWTFVFLAVLFLGVFFSILGMYIRETIKLNKNLVDTIPREADWRERRKEGLLHMAKYHDDMYTLDNRLCDHPA